MTKLFDNYLENTEDSYNEKCILPEQNKYYTTIVKNSITKISLDISNSDLNNVLYLILNISQGIETKLSKCINIEDIVDNKIEIELSSNDTNLFNTYNDNTYMQLQLVLNDNNNLYLEKLHLKIEEVLNTIFKEEESEEF